MRSLVQLIVAALLFTAVTAESIVFNEDWAKYLADLCAASYCTASALDAWSCSACALHPSVQSVTTIEVKQVGADARAFVGLVPDLDTAGAPVIVAACKSSPEH
jgi:hypothetical protein